MSSRANFATLSRWTRQLGAGMVLVVCIRFTWLAASEHLDGNADVARTSLETRATHEGQTVTRKRNVSAESPNPNNLKRLPDLKKLKEMMGEVGSSQEDPDEEKAPALTQRRLVVDMGPERSAVYVNGRNVGEVPYVGMVTCRDGERVKVQVLPKKGLPIERRPHCGDLVPTQAPPN